MQLTLKVNKKRCCCSYYRPN